MLQRDLDRRGLAFFTNSQTEEIFGAERVEGVRLADGREIPADLVVLAIGVRPNIDLARQAGLEVNRGIAVDDAMRTSDENIAAVGECAEHRGQVFGLVAPLWRQAEACAAWLAGEPAGAYAPPALFTSLKITGVDVFSAGALAAARRSRRRDHAERPARRRLQKACPARRKAGRGRALRRCRRRALVCRTHAGRAGRRADPRPADVRPRLRGGARGSLPRGRARPSRRTLRGGRLMSVAPRIDPVRTTCPYCGVGCGVSSTRPAPCRATRRTRRTPAACARRARRSARPSISAAGFSTRRSTAAGRPGTRRWI